MHTVLYPKGAFMVISMLTITQAIIEVSSRYKLHRFDKFDFMRCLLLRWIVEIPQVLSDELTC